MCTPVTVSGAVPLGRRNEGTIQPSSLLTDACMQSPGRWGSGDPSPEATLPLPP